MLLESLFPPAVVVEASDEEIPPETLHASELDSVRHAVPWRRREFAAGRDCARRALARLGIHAHPLPSGVDRSPAWPRGIVGSISHCAGLCAAAVARRRSVKSIGLDIELRAPLDATLVPGICTPHEREALGFRLAPGGLDPMKIVFSAKESFFKCLYSLRPVLLDFQDVEIDLDPTTSTFRARMARDTGELADLARALLGRFAWDERYVFTGITAAHLEGETAWRRIACDRGGSCT